MPKSPIRRKRAFTPPPAKAPAKVGSPVWLAPLMVACFVIGLIWIVVYYLSGTLYPIPGIDWGNMVISLVLIIAGFGLATRWK